jgi:hypothetical protein
MPEVINPWLQAASDMAESEVGVTITYQLVSGGPALSLRAIRNEFEDLEGDGLGPRGGRKTRAVTFDLPLLQIREAMGAVGLEPDTFRPQRGDLIGIAALRGWRVEEATQDAEGASWTVRVKRQDG